MGFDGVRGVMAPRKINVRKFAESRINEIEKLKSIVSERLSNDFKSRRNKRRRTTSHDDQNSNRKSRKRRKGNQLIGNVDSNAVKPDKLPPRHVRRRIELKSNPEGGFCTSGDGTRRLRTHVWHAKRFTMIKLWGFHLPLGLQGRGRGSRALLKRYKQGVFVHDASYDLVVQLDGPEDSLTSVLGNVLIPSPSSQPMELTSSILSGSTYGCAMLHHPGTPLSRPIAPVTYMWRPLENQSRAFSAKDCPSNADIPSNIVDCSACPRRVWVWIHASAFNEGYNALKAASEKEKDKQGSQIGCCSLEGQLAKLQIMGANAFHLLQKTLHVLPCASEQSFELKRHMGGKLGNKDGRSKSLLLGNEEHFSSGAILPLVVKDPRICRGETTVDIPESDCAISAINNMLSHQAQKHSPIVENLQRDVDLHSADMGDPGHKDLWDVCDGLKPSLEEHILQKEAHDKRMEYFCISGLKKKMDDATNSSQFSRSCPIMLLQNHSLENQFTGWSLMLPLAWVKAFWIPLVTNGAHAIGLREKHWIACNTRLPFFPVDFPDCSAYTSFMEVEAAAANKKGEGQSPAVRPIKTPIRPPWNSIRSTLAQAPIVEKDVQILEEIVDSSYSTSNLGSNGVDMTSHDSSTSSFGGFVARTTSELSYFLKNTGWDDLLLFPYKMDSTRNLLKALKDEAKVYQRQSGISLIKTVHKLCFIRIILCPFKEGAFEEGAVICAPHYKDISLMISRSDNNRVGLQVPQSAIASSFPEISSDKQEDPVCRESFRQPIGFITSGHVRGSEKPVAEAVCEASSLACLREEQWAMTPVKERRKEVYVLVRNLRSSAYRLAVATVILELQEEDVEFL